MLFSIHSLEGLLYSIFCSPTIWNKWRNIFCSFASVLGFGVQVSHWDVERWKKFIQQSSLTCGCAFCCFSYPQSTTVLKYYMENSRNKQFISFKLHTVLSSMIKPHTIPYFWIISLSSHPCSLCFPPVSHLVAIPLSDLLSWYSSVYDQVTLILLNNGTKAQSSDAGNFNMPRINVEMPL